MKRELQRQLQRRGRARALRRSWLLPKEPHPVHFPAPSAAPVVSVIIPVFNRWQYTNGCLRALHDTLSTATPMEIVVVDDGSTDRTAELLAACTGVAVVRMERNAGFAAACNAGAARARGTYLHFLNNDAFVSDGWLEPLVRLLDNDAGAAAAVSQLRYPDDSLGEAGGIIWSDGRGSNYGRGEHALDWRFRSVRPVDYGSAASLMVRRSSFEAAGGFSAAYHPAYYEDVDLCFTLRERGQRVLYQPASVVSHVEGVSYQSNADGPARAAQDRSRARFVEKWGTVLQAHHSAEPAAADRAARRLSGSQIALIVDDHVPFVDRDAGSRRIAFLIDELRKRDWHVVFATIDPSPYAPYTELLRQREADVLLGADATTVARVSQQLGGFDLHWICRPVPAARIMPALAGPHRAPIAFDTVDLHYLRLEREERISGRTTQWQAMKTRELALARAADVTIVTSDVEAAILRESGVDNTSIIPVIEPSDNGTLGWASRNGLIFLGNYAHSPNVDAAVWLCKEIMPLVWSESPGMRVTLAGTDPPPLVTALANDLVRVPGFVPDIDPLIDASRVFVAPLRFGAGVKGKIVRAMAHGIPVVTTPAGAEGILPNEHASVGAGASAIAQRVLRLYDDAIAWQQSRDEGFAIAQRFSPERVGADLDALLERLFGRAASRRRQ